MNDNKAIPGTCRLLRVREVLSICGLSRATLYREIKLHDFPAPLRISARSVAWLQDEVVEWLESRIKLRAANQRAKESKADRNGPPKPHKLTVPQARSKDESE